MKKVFLSALILLGAACSTQGGDGLGTIDVSVRDLNGDPIPGATVYAFKTDRIGSRIPRFTADSEGKFILRNVPSGNYEIHAYKESEGYPDTFYSFFANGNKKAWRVVDVHAGRTTTVLLDLGPKYARLKLEIKNELGTGIGASLTFRRVDDPQRPYGVGSDSKGETILLVPPVPFRLEVAAQSFQVWHSKVLRPRSNETLNLTIQLTRSR